MVNILNPMSSMQNVRVVQRNLVYAVGLAMEICYEDTLMGPEYFGAFGKTFKRQEDATKCIEAVNGVIWGGEHAQFERQRICCSCAVADNVNNCLSTACCL